MPEYALATKYPEYVDKAIDALKTRPEGEINLRRIVRELTRGAQDFKKDSYQRLVLEGFTLAIEGKVDQSRGKFKAAVARGGGVPVALQMMRMLELVSEYVEAFSIIKEQWGAILHSPELYRVAWSALCRMGYLLSAHTLTKQVSKTGIATEAFDNERMTLLFAKEIDEIELARVVGYINDHLQKKRLPAQGHRINLVEIEEGRVLLMYEFLCQLSPEASVELEAEIIKGVLAKKFPVMETRAAIFVINPCEDVL